MRCCVRESRHGGRIAGRTFATLPRVKRVHANLLLLFAGAVWGLTFVAQSSAMANVGPFQFIAARFAVACALLAPLAWTESRRARARGETALERIACVRFAIIGVVLFTGMGLQQVGLLTTSVTHSGFLTGLYVVFTPMLVVLLFRERPHPVVWPAAGLSFAGVFLLSGGEWHALVAGDWLTIGSAVCWALQVALVARFVQRATRPFALCLWQFGVTALLAAIVAMLVEPFVLEAFRLALPEILFAGVLGSAVAFTLQVVGQQYTTAPQAALFLSSEAPFAALCAALVLGERIGLIGLVGCTLIFAAMLTVELLPGRIGARQRALDEIG